MMNEPGIQNQNSGPDRQLSCFFCRELFSLYIEDRLDHARRSQIQQHFKTCVSCTQAFEKITKAREVISGLSGTTPNPGLIEYLKSEQYFWTEFYDRVGWRNWPATLKWAVELIGVAVVLVSLIHLLPWFNLARTLKNLRPIPRMQSMAKDVKVDPGANTDAIEQTQEVHQQQLQMLKPAPTPFIGPLLADGRRSLEAPAPSPVPPSVTQGPPPGAAPVTAGATDALEAPIGAAGAASAPLPKLETRNVPVAKVESDKPVENPKAAPVTGDKSDDKVTDKTEAAAPGPVVKPAGFVWKGTLAARELNDETLEHIKKAIIDLGGVQAGQAELGAIQDGKHYYHFILPEENYGKLQIALADDGLLALNKEPHPRVIKEGYRRIIMTVVQEVDE